MLLGIVPLGGIGYKIVNLYQNQSKIELWHIVVFVLAIAILIIVFYYNYYKALKDKVEFHLNRGSFIKKYGTLIDYIEPGKEIWIAMWTSSKNWQSEVFEQPQLRKMIIQHPDSYLVKTFAKTENGDLVTYQKNIVIATSNAIKKSVEVVWANEAIIGLIINVEKSNKGWVRTEYFIPHSISPEPYPSFIVYENNKNENDLYTRLKQSFLDMFGSKINTTVTKEMVTEWKQKLGIEDKQNAKQTTENQRHMEK